MSANNYCSSPEGSISKPLPTSMAQPEYRVHKHHRRVSSTGGGRAWTEEEEAYLLQTRMHKMPYKHIAAHLKKTELACRLHYHQMSYGNHSRRRSDSISSIGSFNSVTIATDSLDNVHHTQLSPVASPRSSPEPGMQQRMSSADSSPLEAHRAPVPILPKPISKYAPLGMEQSVDYSKSHGPDSLQTNMAYPRKEEQHSFIDYSRLRAIYEEHSVVFWSKIAAEYSRDTQEVSAKLAEEEIIRSFSKSLPRAHLPMTPNSTPKSSPEPQVREWMYNRGFRAVNEPKSASVDAAVEHDNTPRSLAERCSVSALLC